MFGKLSRVLKDSVIGPCAKSFLTAIGSGGPYALAAARALIDLPDYDAKAIGELDYSLFVTSAISSIQIADSTT
jgi:ATP-dependent protease HslVU (ClpYQ) peptidase subunit